jgi:hypothetical protein
MQLQYFLAILVQQVDRVSHWSARVINSVPQTLIHNSSSISRKKDFPVSVVIVPSVDSLVALSSLLKACADRLRRLQRTHQAAVDLLANLHHLADRHPLHHSRAAVPQRLHVLRAAAWRRLNVTTAVGRNRMPWCLELHPLRHSRRLPACHSMALTHSAPSFQESRYRVLDVCGDGLK